MSPFTTCPIILAAHVTIYLVEIVIDKIRLLLVSICKVKFLKELHFL